MRPQLHEINEFEHIVNEEYVAQDVKRYDVVIAKTNKGTTDHRVHVKQTRSTFGMFIRWKTLGHYSGTKIILRTHQRMPPKGGYEIVLSYFVPKIKEN